MPAAPPQRLYGRRKGKPLRAGQEALLEALLPRLAIPLSAAAESLDPATLFTPRREAVWLEIGFGGGEHLAAQARAHRDIGFIGCEPFLNGIVKLLGAVAEEALDNVRLRPDDARPLLAALKEGSIARAFVLFPDPWPKKRHHKRRFVAPGNLDLLARVLRDGAELRLATDDADYAAWMLEVLAGHAAFEGPAGGSGGFAERPADWPATRYEAKALAAGRRPVYLCYRRRPRPRATQPEILKRP
jgi:tRNA (guanine-N7-)-methyltransferase